MKRKSIVRWFGLFVSLPVSLILLVMAYTRNRDRQIELHQDILRQTIGTLDAAAIVYAKEHGNHLPPAENWEQVLRPDTGNIPIQVPIMPGGAGKRVAMNSALVGRSLESIGKPADAILFYESTATTASPVDELTSLVPVGDPSPLLFGFADGHIEEVTPPSRRGDVLARSREACKVSRRVAGRGKDPDFDWQKLWEEDKAADRAKRAKETTKEKR